MRGEDFLKEMNNLEDDLIKEAQNPQPKRIWNGNVVRVAAAVACVTLFVGGVVVSSLNREENSSKPAAGGNSTSAQKPVESTGTDTIYILENENGETELIVPEVKTSEANGETSAWEEQTTYPDTWNRIDFYIDENGNKVTIANPMVLVKGMVYTSTGEIIDDLRCGMMDGTITSTVAENEIPCEDNQSNFGTGYSYQKVDPNHIDVCIEGMWIRFAADETIIPKEWETETMSPEEEITTSWIIDMNDTSDIVMQVAGEDDISATGGRFVISYNEAVEGTGTEQFYLNQKTADGVWEPCEIVGEHYWNDIAWILQPGKQHEFDVYWERAYGVLEPGTYQLVKTVYVSGVEKILTAEFTIH